MDRPSDALHRAAHTLDHSNSPVPVRSGKTIPPFIQSIINDSQLELRAEAQVP